MGVRVRMRGSTRRDRTPRCALDLLLTALDLYPK